MKEKSKPDPVLQGGSATDWKHTQDVTCWSSLRRRRLKPPRAASRFGRNLPPL